MTPARDLPSRATTCGATCLDHPGISCSRSRRVGHSASFPFKKRGKKEKGEKFGDNKPLLFSQRAAPWCRPLLGNAASVQHGGPPWGPASGETAFSARQGSAPGGWNPKPDRQQCLHLPPPKLPPQFCQSACFRCIAQHAGSDDDKLTHALPAGNGPSLSMQSKVSSEYLAPAGEEEESAFWRQTKGREPEPLRGPPERPFGEAHLSSLQVRDRACAQVEVPRSPSCSSSKMSGNQGGWTPLFSFSSVIPLVPLSSFSILVWDR